MAYIAWLVERGVFKKIEVSFLPVGHTHNEPDQVASRYSVACRKRDIHTLEAFMVMKSSSKICLMFIMC